MNNDDFEKRLQRQTLRNIPGEWRSEILSAAHTTRPEPSLPGVRPNWLTTLLWPHPKAWAALAAAWIAICILNFAMRDESLHTAARRPAPLSSESLQALKQQKQLFAELMGSTRMPESDRPRITAPQPRSQRREEILAG